MTSRTTLFMLMALIFGAAAVFLARQWLLTQHATPGATAAANVATVVVAAKDLAFGTHLTADDLKEVNWPADSQPQGAFSSKDKLLASSPVVIRRLAANEPVLPSKLSGPTARTSLSAQIGESLRAVSVRVNDVVGVAGFILPGDRVDVMVTREIDKDHRITDIVLQNVKVIGIDQNADEDASGTHVVKSVTLEASTEQAQQLTLGASVGELSLALRNYLDVNSVPVRTVTVADLRYGGEVTPGAKPLPRRTSNRVAGASILVTRGTDSSVYRIR